MSQVQFSPLSIYKSIDGNQHGVESSVLKAWGDPVTFPSNWQDVARQNEPAIIVVESFEDAVAAVDRGYRVRSARDERDELQEAFRPSGGRQGHAVPFVPLVSANPVGDGNDSEAAK